MGLAQTRGIDCCIAFVMAAVVDGKEAGCKPGEHTLWRFVRCIYMRTVYRCVHICMHMCEDM